MQTILGSGGAIGTPLAKELMNYTDRVRLVARNPTRVNPTDELMSADLTQRDAVNAAVAGSEVVYLTVGLEYNLKVWKRDWPAIMQYVIDACLENKAKLVFLDNVYMYDADGISNMTEATAVNPPSEKGKVRAEVQNRLLKAVRDKGLQASIARSADFYGPMIKNSPLGISVVEEFKKGKKAFWQMDASKLHAFTYTPDAARGMALLGNTPDTFGQVWHLPTSSEKRTGKDFIEMVAREMNVKPRYYIFSKWMMSALGLFVPILRELKEMAYQYDRDYIFNSSKFEQRFNFKPISYLDGVRAMVKAAAQD